MVVLEMDNPEDLSELYSRLVKDFHELELENAYLKAEAATMKKKCVDIEAELVHLREIVTSVRKDVGVGFIDFVEIGTSDFDTEIQKNDNRIGISVDAVKYYINRLPNKRGCTKLNSGVSNFNGEISINYLSVETIEKYSLPTWVRGCNSVNHYHPTVTNLLAAQGIQIKDVAESYIVPCKTLTCLLAEYNVQGFYLLKVDTEGHDSVILEHFLRNSRSNLLPHEIIFESNELTSEKDTDNIIDISNERGYDLISRDHDTILRLNLNRIQRAFIFSGEVPFYYIQDYQEGYDPCNLPHENTLEAAKDYCIKHKCSGITYQYGRYEVRSGKYMEYQNDSVSSWILY